MVLMCCLDIGVCWGGCDRLCIYAGGGNGDNSISANQSFATSTAMSLCSTKKDAARPKFDFVGAAERAKQVDGQCEGGLASGRAMPCKSPMKPCNVTVCRDAVDLAAQGGGQVFTSIDTCIFFNADNLAC